MDDTGQIILIVLVTIISIASQIAKAVKKTKGKNNDRGMNTFNVPSNGVPSTDSEEFESLPPWFTKTSPEPVGEKIPGYDFDTPGSMYDSFERKVTAERQSTGALFRAPELNVSAATDEMTNVTEQLIGRRSAFSGLEGSGSTFGKLNDIGSAFGVSEGGRSTLDISDSYISKSSISSSQVAEAYRGAKASTERQSYLDLYKFDLRKAVIYSEILNPKYQD